MEAELSNRLVCLLDQRFIKLCRLFKCFRPIGEAENT